MPPSSPQKRPQQVMICMRRLHNETSCQPCVSFYYYLLCYIINIYQYRCFQSGFRNCPSSAGCDIERYNFSVHPHQPPAARHCQPVTPHLFRSQPFKYNPDNTIQYYTIASISNITGRYYWKSSSYHLSRQFYFIQFLFSFSSSRSFIFFFKRKHSPTHGLLFCNFSKSGFIASPFFLSKQQISDYLCGVLI